MGSNWPLVRIEDIYADKKGAIAIGPFGSRMKSDCYVEAGVPVIRGTNLGESPMFKNEFVYISEKKADSLGSCNVFKDDLVFPHRGSIGEVGIINDDKRYVISSSLMKLTCDKSKVKPKFLYYFFKSLEGKHELLKNASQVGTPGIGQPLTSLKRIEFRNPPLLIQDAIVTHIEVLNKKIELNQKTNQTLEQMALALFKSWFVDFDPVFDNLLASADFKLENLENRLPDELKQKGQRRLVALNSLENAADVKASLSALAHELQAQLPTKAATQAAVSAAETPVKANFNANPNILAQHANTHAHFPNEFEHNEQLGWIPKGWTLEPISSFGEVVCGKTPSKKKSEFYGDEIPFIKIPDMHNNVFTVKTIDNLSLAGDNSQPKKRIPKDSVCVSSIATVGLVTITTKQSHTNQQINSIIPKDKSFRDYLYFSMMNLNKTFHDLASGGSATLNMNTSSFSKILVRMPSVELIKRFDSETRPLFNKIHKNMENNIVLTNLRDTLLPKLISGELLIPDVTADEEVAD